MPSIRVSGSIASMNVAAGGIWLGGMTSGASTGVSLPINEERGANVGRIRLDNGRGPIRVCGCVQPPAEGAGTGSGIGLSPPS